MTNSITVLLLNFFNLLKIKDKNALYALYVLHPGYYNLYLNNKLHILCYMHKLL